MLKEIRASASLIAASLLLLMVLASPVSSGVNGAQARSIDPATFWNHITTNLGSKLDPPRMARAYALVHVAIYDSMLASSNHRKAELNAAAAGAASEVLIYLFPDNATAIHDAARASLGDSQNPGGITGGFHFGQAVGDMVVQHGENDGSSTVFTGTIPTGDCTWAGVSPLEPLAGHWETWLTTSGSEFQPEAQYPCGSRNDLLDVQAVLSASLTRTPEQIAIVHKWADVSPPAIWNSILNDRIARNDIAGIASARAYAYLSIAIYDAFVSCWSTKYTFWTARPFQRIPGLVTVIKTPNFPSYSSGHSTISAAASAVMGELFPEEAIYFDGQAHEAAMSRLWAGIHFPHDNEQGLIVGHEIGMKVVQDMNFEPHTFVFPKEKGAVP